MSTVHLSEQQLQQYALTKGELPAPLKAHVESCAQCKAQAEHYALVFSIVKDLPAPVFDFDVAGNVLSALPANKKGAAFRWNAVFVTLAAAVLVAVVGFASYKYLRGLFATLDMHAFLLVALTLIGFLAAGIHEAFQLYTRKLKALAAL